MVFNNSLKLILNETSKYYFNENDLSNNANAYVKPKISQAKHYTGKSKPLKKISFPEKSGNS